MSKPKTVRQACRDRDPLDGADAQALEHALTITERERDEARAQLDRLRGGEPIKTGDELGEFSEVAHYEVLIDGTWLLWKRLYLHRGEQWSGTMLLQLKQDIPVRLRMQVL